MSHKFTLRAISRLVWELPIGGPRLPPTKSICEFYSFLVVSRSVQVTCGILPGWPCYLGQVQTTLISGISLGADEDILEMLQSIKSHINIRVPVPYK